MTKLEKTKRGLPVHRSVTPGEPRRAVSWSEIERTILLRIARKEYVPGQRIPTCEAIAAEFGANKNTANKAYRSLAKRGYLLTRAGTGTFVSHRRVRVPLDSLVDGITGLVTLAVQEAKLCGLQQVQFRRLVDEVISQGYGQSGLRIGFIECNRHDATMLSRDLQIAISHPIEPLLIDDVLAEPAYFLDEFDILAVNITHLSPVESAFGARACKHGAAEVLGMHTPIDPDSLVQVARLRPGTRVGIVCDLTQTLATLTGLVDGYNAALVVDGCVTRDKAALRKLVDSSDVLLVTPSAAGRLKLIEAQTPIVTLAFQLDSRSIEKLLTLIARRMPAPVVFDTHFRLGA